MAHLGVSDTAQNRKLLVSDVPVRSASEDALGHQDVATLLSRVLADWLSEPEPLHIALYGPWGAGKSGVISLLKTQIEQNNALRNAVYLLDFSLWKFGAENVRRGLLLFLDGREGLGTETKMAERLSKSSARTVATTTIDWWRFAKWLLLGALLVAVYLVTPVVTDQSSTVHRLLDKLVSVGIVLSVAVGAISSIAKMDLQTQVSEGSSSPPPDRADQFKEVFEELLRKARSRGKKDGSEPWNSPQKLILVFDDLDRVPPSLAWDVLTTVKTFMDSPHCVYIVPCDRDAVVEAMRSQSGPQIEARAIDFLDKFFQVSFILPATYPREFRQIADQLCQQLSLSPDVAAIAVAGFYKTPRSLKVFLNQVSLLAEFIAVRNQRLGVLPTKDLLLKVAKVHAIRVLWPSVGRAIAEMPALMLFLEQSAQGIGIQERSEITKLAESILTPSEKAFAPALREFLVATLGTVVGRDAQSAVKLSEAIWAEAHGELDSMRTYLATGDSEGLRALFERGGIETAVGVARDAFSSENQTATPEMLVGWTGTLLQAFFGDSSREPAPAVVDLTVEWASSPQVSPSLAKLPPTPLVRAIASSESPQASAAGSRILDLTHQDLAIPLPDYTVSLLRALSANRALIIADHPQLSRQLRDHLRLLATPEYRVHFLLRVDVLSQGVPGSDWQLWWDDDLGTRLSATISGAESSAEDNAILEYLGRTGYTPSADERRSAVKTASRLFQESSSSVLQAGSQMAIALIVRVALSGPDTDLLAPDDAATCARFVTQINDPEQRLSVLLPLLRLVSSSAAAAKAVILEQAHKPSMATFSSPQVNRVLDLLADVKLGSAEEWIEPLLERCVELRDSGLFIMAADRSRNSEAIAASLTSALRMDETFADSLLPRVQTFCDAARFGEYVTARVSGAAIDPAGTARLVAVLQALQSKPDLQNSTWHTIATRLEQGVMNFSEPSQSQSLRRTVTTGFLGWLPDPDQRHLADFSTAVISGAQEQPNDLPDNILAKVEAGLMFESLCDDRQVSLLAKGAAHVLAWPTFPPTAISQIVEGIRSRPRLIASITDDGFDAIAMARDTRSDEGGAFLSGLLELRPVRPAKSTKEKPTPKKKRD